MNIFVNCLYLGNRNGVQYNKIKKLLNLFHIIQPINASIQCVLLSWPTQRTCTLLSRTVTLFQISKTVSLQACMYYQMCIRDSFSVIGCKMEIKDLIIMILSWNLYSASLLKRPGVNHPCHHLSSLILLGCQFKADLFENMKPFAELQFVPVLENRY